MMSTPRRAATDDLPSLVDRLDRLESLAAIQALKARYGALADAKYTADYARVDAGTMRKVAWEQAQCFTDDAVWEAGEGFGANRVGRDALFDWFQQSPWCFAVHYYGSPVIDVAGDTASGTWRLWQIAMADDTREAVLLAAVTHESYARQADGAWLHSRMRFEQLHMLPAGRGPAPLAATLAALASRRSASPMTLESPPSC
ncbi:nuclear transport factor 2 family protein [Pigmentiphaga litoralis]|uniref:nuclear transport factor 2 family protein n=1 Tax=Pigmentiphaga litoralis TaxID=516702 RepID=UPI003B433B67